MLLHKIVTIIVLNLIVFRSYETIPRKTSNFFDARYITYLTFEYLVRVGTIICYKSKDILNYRFWP